MKTKSTLTTVLILIFLACHVEDNTSTEIHQETSAKTIYDFDNYGISHNLAMDHIATMPNFNTATLQDIFIFADSYTDAYINNSCPCNDWQTHEQDMDMLEQVVENMSTAGDMLASMNIIKQEEVQLTNMLFSIIDNSISEQNQTYKTIQEFTTEVEAFENYVINNHIVVYDPVAKTGNFTALILGASSIAKHSYSYWITALENSSHPWNYRLMQLNTNNRSANNMTSFQKNPWEDFWRGVGRGIKRIGSDVGGFLVGGKCGGILDGRDVECAVKHAKKKSSGVRN